MPTLPEQVRDLLNRHGSTAPVWRRRVAIVGGAVAIGLVALIFAHMADWAGERFTALAVRWWWASLIAGILGGLESDSSDLNRWGIPIGALI